jgi:hypothetical protein
MVFRNTNLFLLIWFSILCPFSLGSLYFLTFHLLLLITPFVSSNFS